MGRPTGRDERASRREQGPEDRESVRAAAQALEKLRKLDRELAAKIEESPVPIRGRLLPRR